ncbi:MAG: hypothetical protein MRJ67_00795 [Nitrospirales bacterium]|nr:hypothetical protein [Nitrospirales bacterium]
MPSLSAQRLGDQRRPRSGSDAGADAVGSQVQCLVGRASAAADCVSTLHYAPDM